MRFQYLSIIFIEAVVICILFFINLKNNYEKQRQQLTIQELKLHNKSIVQMYDGIRCFKHDFINFIQALSGYVQCNDLDGVRQMISSVYRDCKKVCNLEAINPNIINNSAIYSLIENKYDIALKNDVLMNIEANVDLSCLLFDSYNICRMIGILIDNAIEAAKNTENKLVNLRFENEENTIKIVVENSYTNHDIDMNKIFEKGYSTKEKSEGHGLGLWKVGEIINSSKNYYMNTIKGELFTQELMIRKNSFAFSSQNDKILLHSK